MLNLCQPMAIGASSKPTGSPTGGVVKKEAVLGANRTECAISARGCGPAQQCFGSVRTQHGCEVALGHSGTGARQPSGESSL